MSSSQRHALLSSLHDVGEYLLPEKTLFADVNNRLASPVTHSEFRELLADLEANKRIVSIRDEDKNLKWKITENGRARLAELR